MFRTFSDILVKTLFCYSPLAFNYTDLFDQMDNINYNGRSRVLLISKSFFSFLFFAVLLSFFFFISFLFSFLYYFDYLTNSLLQKEREQ